MSDYLIIGPTKVGKTAMLSSLQHAAFNPSEDEKLRIGLDPRNDEMRNLLAICRDTIQAGRIPVSATTAITDYTFDLEISYKRLGFIPKTVTSRFTFADGPGGSLMPEVEGKNVIQADVDNFRNRLIQRCKTSEGLILCVDAGDDNKAGVFFRFLPDLLGRADQRPLPFRRIVVCLTRADRHFSGRRRGAHDAAKVECPIKRGRELLTNDGLNALRFYCRDATIGFCWTSAYGFLDDGSTNYDPENDRLRFWGDAQSMGKVVNGWRPFQVLDPLVFLATGMTGGLKILPT